MDQSSVTVSNGATTFAGRDAVLLYQALTLRSAIALHRKCGMIPTRGATITRLLASATALTGRTYKRGAHAAAEGDLTVWIETMKSALPITRD